MPEEAALDGGPGTTEDAGEIFPEKSGVIRWHIHGFSSWGEIFSANASGLIGAFTGGSSGPWWQGRSCVRCNLAQYRRVEILADRS